MPINQGDLVQLTFVGRWEQQVIMLTHFLKCRTPPTGSQPTSAALQDLITKVAPANIGELGSCYLDCLPDNYTLRIITAQKIYPAREVLQSQAMSIVGTWPTAEALTGNNAGVITLRTDKAGRSQVSNKHIGPLPSDAMAIGNVTGAWNIKANVLGEALINPISPVAPVAYDPIIYHKNGDGAVQKSDLIASYALQTTVRVMRRRTVGLGI